MSQWISLIIDSQLWFFSAKTIFVIKIIISNIIIKFNLTQERNMRVSMNEFYN